MHSNKRYSTINYFTKYKIPVYGRLLFSLLSWSYSVFFIVQQNVISLLLTSLILISVIFLKEYNLECHLLFKLFVSYNNYQLGNTGNKRGAASVKLAV